MAFSSIAAGGHPTRGKQTCFWISCVLSDQDELFCYIIEGGIFPKGGCILCIKRLAPCKTSSRAILGWDRSSVPETSSFSTTRQHSPVQLLCNFFLPVTCNNRAFAIIQVINVIFIGLQIPLMLPSSNVITMLFWEIEKYLLSPADL